MSLDYLLGFRWLRSLSPSITPQSAAAGALPQTPEEKILQLCQRPIALGELADATELSYYELRPKIARLMGDRKLTTCLRPVGSLNAIHYHATNNHERETTGSRASHAQADPDQSGDRQTGEHDSRH